MTHWLSRRSQRTGRRLRFEALEGRRLLATYTVDSLTDNTLDDGLTTLREAIALANAAVDADTIDFAAGLFSSGQQTLLVTEGQLEIDEETTINGPGAELLTIDASGNDPTPDEIDGLGTSVFHVRDSGFFDREVIFRGLTMTGGDTNRNGGAIESEEPLTIEDSVLMDNHTSNNGGGIHTEKRLELTRTTVSQNSGFSGGGIFTDDSLILFGSTVTENQSRYDGGGIFIRDANLTINDSEISHNETLNASIDGGGGGIYALNVFGQLNNSHLLSNTTTRNGGGYAQRESSLVLSGGSVIDNQAAGGFGGGVYSHLGNQTTLNRVLLNDNYAQVDGGGLYSNFTTWLNINQSSFENNEALSRGGAVYARNTFSAHVLGSQLSNNTSGSGGGGMFVDRNSNLSVEDTTFSQNTTTAAGGALFIEDASSSIVSSTFNDNSATAGGAIVAVATDNVQLEHSTLSGNQATDSGGAIYSSGADVNLLFSTVVGNQADSDHDNSGAGGGIYANAGAHVSIAHTILAANTDSGEAPDVQVFATPSDIIPSYSMQYSLLGSNLGNDRPETAPGVPDGLGNLVGGPVNGLLAPQLEALADNGGPTWTHAPLSGSPVIDAGDDTIEAGIDFAPTFDQRGNNFGRVQNGRIDIGAFEVRDTPSADFNVDGFVNGTDFLAWQRGYDTNAPEATKSSGDADNDLDVDANDLAIWQTFYGTTSLAALEAPALLTKASLPLGLAIATPQQEQQDEVLLEDSTSSNTPHPVQPPAPLDPLRASSRGRLDSTSAATTAESQPSAAAIDVALDTFFG